MILSAMLVTIIALGQTASVFAVSADPSTSPSTMPSDGPSLMPSTAPSMMPSVTPSSIPSYSPSQTPSTMPSTTPSLFPSFVPSQTPSIMPSSNPSLSREPSMEPSVFPSSAPSIDCVNDENFRVNGVEKYSCAWVAKFKTNRRCQLGRDVKAYDACPGVCNPLCRPGTGPPTTAPSFAPVENRCVNDSTFLVAGYANGNCDWVEMRSRQRCKLEDVGGVKAKDACPGACNLRCTCKNFRGRFRVGLDSKKACKNINNKADCLKSAGTKGKIVADFCPRKCNNCYP